ncbi:sensor histidine kinase [Flavobacterium circumlabens]|nr:sensor histidine kinase [Flavobacterium circumlabens]
MIYITLEESINGHYLLTVADNGIGIENKGTETKINSFGMRLIQGLSEDIDGDFTMEKDNGTILKINFLPEFPISKKFEGPEQRREG